MVTVQHILIALIIVPFLGFLFALMSQSRENGKGHNAIAVSECAVGMNILLLWRIMTQIDLNETKLQFVSHYQWLEVPPIELALGIDVFSLLVALAIHLMLMISLPFAKGAKRPKALVSMSLLMLSLLTGFLLAADIFSFYIFFTAILIPAFILVGTAGEIKRSSWMFRFFIYNFIGSSIFFVVICALYMYRRQEEIILLNSVSRFRLPIVQEYWIWGGIFIALLSRIPIWPFHYWIASIAGYVQNPLVFLLTNLIPLTGIYGLIRFCPKTVPESVTYFLTGLEVIAVISMLFIAMIGLINRDSRYKLFSFMTVYYIMFLLGAMLPTGRLLMNIGYSVFAFLVIVSALEILSVYVRTEQQKYKLNLSGILCQVPRLSLLYSFFTLAAVGFPLSALFINNFVIFSYFFRYNFNLGLIIMGSVIISSASLLKELYVLKDSRYIQPGSACIMDISKPMFYGLGLIGILLLISFCNPLLILGG